jgi:hypothetical protein
MERIELRAGILVLAGALILSGCHTMESFNGEAFKRNPDLVKPGDTVVLYTHSAGKVKGKVVDRSADGVVLKGGIKVSTDDILALEVSRFSAGKTVIAGLLILVGTALVVGTIYLFVYGFGHVA